MPTFFLEKDYQSHVKTLTFAKLADIGK